MIRPGAAKLILLGAPELILSGAAKVIGVGAAELTTRAETGTYRAGGTRR